MSLQESAHVSSDGSPPAPAFSARPGAPLPKWGDVTRKHHPLIVRGATVALWLGAAVSWVMLFVSVEPEKRLGWDLLTTWRAERLFAHALQPYSVKAFVYPPSCLIVLRPLAFLDAHQLTVGGLVVTAVVAWVSVVISCVALGIKWYGPTAAATVLVLSLVGAMRGEMPLENVSILEFLCLAVFFCLVLRNRWVWAAVVIGVSIAIKPLLLVVLVVFVVARKWKALGAAVAVTGLLNVWGLAVVKSPHEVLSKLPSLFNRSGSGVSYNSAWVDVTRSIGLPEGFSIGFRVLTVVAAAVAARLAWTRMSDERLRIVTLTSVLLMGVFLAGTLSEYHYMLALVPLAMTVVIGRSPIRTVTGVVGTLWVMDALAPPAAWFGLANNARDSLFRAVGMSLLIGTVIFVLRRRRPGFESRLQRMEPLHLSRGTDESLAAAASAVGE